MERPQTSLTIDPGEQLVSDAIERQVLVVSCRIRNCCADAVHRPAMQAALRMHEECQTLHIPDHVRNKCCDSYLCQVVKGEPPQRLFCQQNSKACNWKPCHWQLLRECLRAYATSGRN